MADKQEPKCSACGFLSLRNKLTGQLDEVDASFRQTAQPPRRDPIPVHPELPAYGEYPYRCEPICFVQQADLVDEAWGPTGTNVGMRKQGYDPSPSMVRPVLEKERPECSEAYTPWQQGLTPREHREIVDRQQRIEQEEEVREAIWKREDERDKRADERHDQQVEQLRAQHKTELVVLGGLVTLAIVLSTIAGAMIQAGWFGRPW